MRLKVLGYLLGTLLFYLGLVMLLPLAWSITDRGTVFLSFLIPAVLSITGGLMLRHGSGPPEDLSIKESFTFVVLAWSFAALLGTLPYLLSGSLNSFVNAFFESMSGFTTTGATVLVDIEVLPRSILLWRSLTQWLGGMGIIALFIALLPRLGVRSFYLLKAEIPGPEPDRVVPRIAETAKMLWLIYLVISAAEFILLLFCGLSIFDALNHTFTTMPTGGFSTYNDSIAAFGSARVEIIIIFFMLLAGGNFTLYYGIWRHRWRQLFRDMEFRFYLLVICVAAIAMVIIIYPLYEGSPGEATRKAIFQVIAIVTTTGYATADFDSWPALGKMILFFLMFLGGSGGSTGGGMKQIRILILLKYGLREIKKTLHPSAVISLRLGGRVIPENLVHNIVGFSLLYFLIFIIVSLSLGAMGYDIVTSFSVAASCLGNVGPALGALGPSLTYEPLPGAAKYLLSATMLLGRLEIFTILVLLLPEVRSTRFKL